MSNAKLSRMFVTVILSFDPDSQIFGIPKNIKNPTSRIEPGNCHIWSDFKYPEIGNGARYAGLEVAIEDMTTDVPVRDFEDSGFAYDDISPEVTADEHPYLTKEKAKEVGRWVVDGVQKGAVSVNMEVKDHHNSPESQQEVSALETKKVPGIKTRKPVALGKPLIVSQTRTQVPSTVKVVDSKRQTPIITPLNTLGSARAKDVVTAEPTNPPIIPVTPLKKRTVNPGSASMFPPNFDVTKYGLQKATKWQQRSPKQWHRPDGGENKFRVKVPQTRAATLIDTTSSSVNVTAITDQTLRFDQPSLIPSTLRNMGKSPGAELISDLLQEKEVPWGRRLETMRPTADRNDDAVSIPAPSSHAFAAANSLYKKRLADLEKSVKGDRKQEQREMTSREFHHTAHQTSRATPKVLSKAEVKAKRQATLEDAWGMPGKNSILSSSGPPQEQEQQSLGKVNSAKSKAVNETRLSDTRTKQTKGDAGIGISHLAVLREDKDRTNLQQSDKKDEEMVRNLFAALKPTLDAAQSFPGTLSLEIQIGLVLLPLMPKTYGGGMISLEEWNKIFQSRNSILAPSTMFIKRLTSSGADINYILDLKTQDGNQIDRLFESEYSEYEVVYEYHCRTRDDQPILVIIDETGNVVVKNRISVLGAVNVHFPNQTWDASVILRGSVERQRGSSTSKLDSTIQHMVDSIWVQPGRSRVRIFSQMPESGELQIEKVLMKRWTRHRYNRPTNTSPMANVIEGSANQMGNAVDGADKSYQDIFLKITEVQDLFIGTHPSDKSAFRARCVRLDEMVRKGRLWYEVSIVSAPIDEILLSNATLEPGESTDDWCSADLLGEHARLVSPMDIPNSSERGGKRKESNESPVAAAIGNAGLGEMLRLTTKVVENIDGVGYWNCGPGPEALRKAEAEGLFTANNNTASTIIGTALVPTGKHFDLQSASASVRAAHIETIMKREEAIQKFW